MHHFVCLSSNLNYVGYCNWLKHLEFPIILVLIGVFCYPQFMYEDVSIKDLTFSGEFYIMITLYPLLSMSSCYDTTIV